MSRRRSKSGVASDERRAGSGLKPRASGGASAAPATNFMQLKRDPERDWVFSDLLGSGAFGKVFRARRSPKAADAVASAEFPDEVAIKKIVVQGDEREQAEREVALSSQLRSKFVVQFYATYAHKKDFYIVMELCDGGSLQDMISAHPQGLAEKKVRAIAGSLLCALRDIHSLNCCHRDVKPGNILLTRDGRALLADFGISRESLQTVMQFETMIGSPYFMAPEMISAGSESADDGPVRSYSEKIDVWAAGITCISMMDGRPPFYDMNPLHALFQISQATMSPTPVNSAQYSPELAELIECALMRSPTARLSCRQLLDLPFFRGGPPTADASAGRHASPSKSSKGSKKSSKKSGGSGARASRREQTVEEVVTEAAAASSSSGGSRLAHPGLFDEDEDDAEDSDNDAAAVLVPKRQPSDNDLDQVNNWLQTRKDILSVLQDRFMINDGYIGPPIEELRGQAFLQLLQQVDKLQDESRVADEQRRRDARKRRRQRKKQEAAAASSSSSSSGAPTTTVPSGSASFFDADDPNYRPPPPPGLPSGGSRSGSHAGSDPSSSNQGSRDNTAGGGMRDQLREMEMKLERLRSIAGADDDGADNDHDDADDVLNLTSSSGGSRNAPRHPSVGAAKRRSSEVITTKRTSRRGASAPSHGRRASTGGAADETSGASSELRSDSSSSCVPSAASSASSSVLSSMSAAPALCQMCASNPVAARVKVATGESLFLCKPCAVSCHRAGHVPAKVVGKGSLVKTRRPSGDTDGGGGDPISSPSDSRRSSHESSGIRSSGAAVSGAPPPSVSSVAWWTEADVAAWVHDKLRTDAYSQAFADNLVNGELLLTLSDHDLKEIIGISAPLHRRRLMMEITKLATSSAASAEAIAEDSEWKSFR